MKPPPFGDESIEPATSGVTGRGVEPTDNDGMSMRVVQTLTVDDADFDLLGELLWDFLRDGERRCEQQDPRQYEEK